jgi:DNA-binding transcriptional ArsR family regulator
MVKHRENFMEVGCTGAKRAAVTFDPFPPLRRSAGNALLVGPRTESLCFLLTSKKQYGYIAIYHHLSRRIENPMNKRPENTNTAGDQFAAYIRKIQDDKELYKLKAQVAKALAHESRLMIIDALYEKDMCVSELTAMVGVDQSTVSKHLSVLRYAGIIMDRKEGSNKVYYHLRMATIRQFSDLAMGLIQSNLPRAAFHQTRQTKS